MKRKKEIALFVLALGALMSGASRAQEPPEPRPEGGRNVHPAVAEARAKEAALKGLKGAARIAAQTAAADAWADAADALADDKLRAASARASEAELRATYGDLEKAEAAWKAVLELAPEKRGPQALLGLGDLERRRNKHEQALAHYEDLIKRFPNSGARLQEAYVWAGKLHVHAGRMEKAREAYMQVIRTTVSVVRLAEVYDLLIDTYLREGKLEEARRSLAEGREALARLGKLGPTQAKAVEKALERMRAPARIERNEKQNGPKEKEEAER